MVNTAPAIRRQVRQRASRIDVASTVHPLGTDRHQLSESVAMNLRERIMSGKLHAGQFLRIDALARELNVSTTPVREGLLLLQSDSFVRLIPRRGFVVNTFSQGDLRDLFWAQAIIGSELAARAAARISKDDLTRMHELYAAHERAVAAGDEVAAAQAGHQFHRTINLTAQSPRLALLLGGLTKQLPNRFYASVEGVLQNAVRDHRAICDALDQRAEDAARSAMQHHILAGADYLIAALERQGTWAAPSAGGDPPRRPKRPKIVNPAKRRRASR